MVRTAGTRIDLYSQDMGLPPGDDLDGGDEFGGDVVSDEVRQSLLFLQDVVNALDSPRAILDSDKKSASGGVRERDDRLQRAFRGRKVGLEFERLALRPAKEGDQIHTLHFTLMRSWNRCFRDRCNDEEPVVLTARPSHGKQSFQITQIRTIRTTKHCEEICAPALSKWVIIVGIPIAIGEEEGSRNICCESCWRGHKSFIFQRLTDGLMCF